MSNNASGSSSGGIGFAGLLTVAFVVLKLTGFIAWSWWWVLSPLWISVLIAVLIVVAALIAVGVKARP
jgi:hypothetical protein